ncbi:MAG: hypothetical protein FWC80_03820 [Firmicutes bacterium]|nr:hypothetical protein [Bacillota bacterium]
MSKKFSPVLCQDNKNQKILRTTPSLDLFGIAYLVINTPSAVSSPLLKRALFKRYGKESKLIYS